MNENQNNFSTLKQLLKLKQHEVPPPGYFHNFSGQVIARIRAGEADAQQTFIERLQSTAPWLVSFLQAFETKPGLIGAFATSMCLLLVGALFFAERSDSAPKIFPVIADNSPNTMPTVVSGASAPVLVAADTTTGIAVSTNPVLSLQPAPSMFGQANPLFQAQAASFTPANH